MHFNIPLPTGTPFYTQPLLPCPPYMVYIPWHNSYTPLLKFYNKDMSAAVKWSFDKALFIYHTPVVGHSPQDWINFHLILEQPNCWTRPVNTIRDDNGDLKQRRKYGRKTQGSFSLYFLLVVLVIRFDVILKEILVLLLWNLQ